MKRCLSWGGLGGVLAYFVEEFRSALLFGRRVRCLFRFSSQMHEKTVSRLRAEPKSSTEIKKKKQKKADKWNRRERNQGIWSSAK